MIYLNDLSTTFLDFPNDTDQSIIVFFEGCSHNCKGCQNLHLMKQVHAYTKEEVISKIEEQCERHKTNKIVFSGGDPFFKKNIDNLRDMLYTIDTLENKGYNICVYTGYTIEEVLDIYKTENYRSPSFLKCGKFIEETKRLSEKTNDFFKLASNNQNFYKRLSNTHYVKMSNEGVLYFEEVCGET